MEYVMSDMAFRYILMGLRFRPCLTLPSLAAEWTVSMPILLSVLPMLDSALTCCGMDCVDSGLRSA